MNEKILDVKDLAIIFSRQGKPFIAVNQINFDIKKGEIFGLVGESGSGKTTTGRAVLGLVEHAYGTITLDNRRVPASPHYVNKKSNEWLAKNVQMIFQDPLTSLNPSKRTIDIVLEGIKNFNPYKIEAKEFKFKSKIALKWYKKLQGFDEKLIKQYQEEVKQLQELYQQLQTLKQENKIMWIDEKNDINDSFHQSIKAAKTKHQLLIARKLQINREELRNLRFKTKQLLIKTGLADWENKWQTIYDQNIKDLDQEKKSLLKTLQEQEEIYKDKLNAKILDLNNRRIEIDQNLDLNVQNLNQLIINNEKYLQELENKFSLKIAEIKKSYNLKKLKHIDQKNLNLINEQENKILKALELKFKKEQKLVNKRIIRFTQYLANYRLSNLNALKIEINRAKKDLYKLRYQNWNQFKKISKKVEKAEHQWEINKKNDRKNFIDQEKYQIFQSEYQERLKEVNEKFKKLIIEDKKKMPEFSKKAKLKQKQALEKLIKKYQTNENQINKFKLEIINQENKLQQLIKLINQKPKTEKYQLILEEYKKNKKQLKIAHKTEINQLKTSLTKDKEIYQQLIKIKKHYLFANNELIEQCFKKLLKVNLYQAWKLKLKYEYHLNYSYWAVKNRTKAMAIATLESVGLLPEHAHRFPFEFSGGQRQRIGIARALIMQPKLLVADEPISALDVSIQAQVINILKDLRKQYQLSILLVAHDLRMVHYVCDRIAVIRNGVIIEMGSADDIFYHPVHPYTKSLISAVPSINNINQDSKILKYNPHAHGYNEEIKPEWHHINKEHKVLATTTEFELWTKKS